MPGLGKGELDQKNYELPGPFRFPLGILAMASRAGARCALGDRATFGPLRDQPTLCFLNVHDLATTHQQGSVLLTMQSQVALTEPYSGMFWKLSGDAA